MELFAAARHDVATLVICGDGHGVCVPPCGALAGA
jgi:hypothetical protein